MPQLRPRRCRRNLENCCRQNRTPGYRRCEITSFGGGCTVSLPSTLFLVFASAILRARPVRAFSLSSHQAKVAESRPLLDTISYTSDIRACPPQSPPFPRTREDQVGSVCPSDMQEYPSDAFSIFEPRVIEKQLTDKA